MKPIPDEALDPWAKSISDWIDTSVLYMVRDGLSQEEAAKKAFEDLRMPTIVDYLTGNIDERRFTRPT